MNNGEKFYLTFHVNENIYIGFINLFNDTNPLHTDSNYAQQKGFVDKVMHGNILNGFLSYFIGQCLPQHNVIIQTQEIKYLKPVYLDDRLSLYAEVAGIYESVNTIEFKFYFENQDKIKVAKGKIQIGILQ